MKFFRNLFLGLLTITGIAQGQRYEVNSNVSVDYRLTFESESVPSDNTNNLRFSSIYYDSPALITFHEDLNDCKKHCATLDICTGVYEEMEQPLLMENVREIYNSNSSNISNLTWNNTPYITEDLGVGSYCYLLSDLGIGFERVNITSRSYTKIQSHNYSEALGNNTIGVFIIENSPINAHGNSTVYLDLNHNGVLDEMEPNISTQSGREVYFRNLSAGIYLIRSEAPDFCHQLYPGNRGDVYLFSIMGDGFADTVNTYYHHGHSKFVAPHGGYVGSPDILINNNFSFILGNDTSTYLSFYPENNITLGFVDETVTGELIIDVYGESSTWAHVSVSNDNVKFYPAGILTSFNTVFNITKTELNTPVAFVRLHFMGDDSTVPLNLVRIYSPQEDISAPEMGFLVGLPLKDYEMSFYRFVIFYHDCYNEVLCEDYCYYMTNNFNLEESCLTGCNLFYETDNCDCDNYGNYQFVEFYGDKYSKEWCLNGCQYELGWTVSPEFFPILDNTGVETGLMASQIDCDRYCLFDLYDECILNETCHSFSYDRDNTGNLYTGLQYRYEPDNYIMIRRNLYQNFTELTTTTTTTISTLTSSSLTSSTLTSSTLTSTSYTSSTETDTTSTLSLTSSTLTSSTVSTTSTLTESTLTTSTVSTLTTSTVSSTTLSDTSQTDTTLTLTSSTQTESSTTTSETGNVFLESSGSGGAGDNEPVSDDGIEKNHMVIGILFALLLLIVLGFGMIGYVIYKRRNIVVNDPQINRQVVGFDNPIYNREYENQVVPEGLYQDTEGFAPEEYDEDANYLEIKE